MGGREIIYLSLHCHHQNDSCIKMGSSESHFNVSLIVRDKATRHCDKPQHTHNRDTTATNHNLFAEKGKPEQGLLIACYILTCLQS